MPFLVAHLSLCNERGEPLDTDATGATHRLLYGTLVSSAQILRNLRGHNWPYFIFPDVSVRQRGRYTLKITLMRLPRFASLFCTQGQQSNLSNLLLGSVVWVLRALSKAASSLQHTLMYSKWYHSLITLHPVSGTYFSDYIKFDTDCHHNRTHSAYSIIHPSRSPHVRF